MCVDSCHPLPGFCRGGSLLTPVVPVLAPRPRCPCIPSWRQQVLKAGDLITWDPNGNGYYIKAKNRWYTEDGRYDEKGAGGGLGQWDRDHHYDVWGKPLFLADTGVRCMHAGCAKSDFAGDV